MCCDVIDWFVRISMANEKTSISIYFIFSLFRFLLSRNDLIQISSSECLFRFGEKIKLDPSVTNHSMRLIIAHRLMMTNDFNFFRTDLFQEKI